VTLNGRRLDTIAEVKTASGKGYAVSLKEN
jgi:hypothetical protein